MTQQEKIAFVRELVDDVSAAVVTHIESGRVPDGWDGIELRELLSDHFLGATRKMGNARREQYNNTVIVSDLI
jgi:hypothetical protein